MQKHQQNSMSPSAQFQFGQAFGVNDTDQPEDEDIISTLKFDPTGKFLCIGDHAGRVIIFKEKDHAQEIGQQQIQPELYNYYAEFQSHIRQIDPLKGVSCSEKIIDISWLRPQGKYLKLLTTNCKTIRMWKAFEKSDKKPVKVSKKDIFMPKLSYQDFAFSAYETHTFPSLHSTEINSISHSFNEEYLLSTDEEQSFLWNLQKPKKPYIVNSIDKCKNNSSSQQPQITCSKMHPKSDSIFVYGMNRCELGVCDTRVSGKGKVLDFGLSIRSMKNFFMDMVATIRSAQFLQNGKYIVSREYLNTKIWDITNTKKPVMSICVEQSLKSELANLFEKNCIYDKFQVSTSSDCATILTGNYNNTFHLINFQDGSNTQYELNFKKQTIKRKMGIGRQTAKEKGIKSLDIKRKSSILTYHPHNNTVAVAVLNNFFVYSLPGENKFEKQRINI